VTERHGLGLYLSRQASGLGRYLWEQSILTLCGWVPTVVGIGLRAVVYRLIMHLEGLVAIERGVRIRFAEQIRLGRGVYLDEGVYLHACPGGIEIGENTLVMHHAELHVYNFRGLPPASGATASSASSTSCGGRAASPSASGSIPHRWCNWPP